MFRPDSWGRSMNNQAWRLFADYGVTVPPAAERLRASPPEPHYPAWIPGPLRYLVEIVVVTALTLVAVVLFAFAIYANAARALMQVLRTCLHRSDAGADLEQQGPWDWPYADADKNPRSEGKQPGGLG